MNKKSIFRRFFFISAAFIIAAGISLNVTAKTEDGLKHIGIGEFEKAEALFSEVLKGDAGNVEAAYYLGLSLIMQEKFDAALNVFQNLKTNLDKKDFPTKGQVEIGIVKSYLGLKNYSEALKSLEAAEKAKADPVNIYTYRGAYYLEINENRKADEAIKKALDLNSQNPYTYYYAGVVNIRIGDPATAVKYFETFLSMAPYVPEAKHAKFLIDTLC